MRNGLWPRMIKHMTQVTRAPGRNGPAFASANHANSTLAAAADTIENTTFLHASPPYLVATDKSSKFLSVARMVSACQPMQSCTRTARRRISPRCKFRAQASGMPINSQAGHNTLRTLAAKRAQLITRELSAHDILVIHQVLAKIPNNFRVFLPGLGAGRPLLGRQ